MSHAGDVDSQYPGLTPRQRDIVCFCGDFRQCHGYPPTLREIGAAVGLNSTSSVAYQVRQLQQKGYLSHDVGRPRTTRPLTPARDAASQPPLEPGEDEQTLVPVRGKIAAGGPITAVDLPGEYVPVPSGIVGSHKHYALEVKGDSMIGKAIISGDRVVVRLDCDVRNGDTVVAMFEPGTAPWVSPETGDATLKTFKRVDGHIWLLPENPAYDPIPGDQAKIVGKVVYIARTTA